MRHCGQTTNRKNEEPPPVILMLSEPTLTSTMPPGLHTVYSPPPPPANLHEPLLSAISHGIPHYHRPSRLLQGPWEEEED